MKIGIIGTTGNVNAILLELQENFPNIEPVPAYSDTIEENPPIVQKLEAETDAILFTGPNNYDYTVKHLGKPKKPWSYVPHNRVSALQALMQASVLFHNEITSISLDSYAKEPVQQALRSVGLTQTKIKKMDFDLERNYSSEQVYKFHHSCYQEDKNNIALTSFGYSALLQEANIPCVRILAASEAIHEQIYLLQLKVLTQQDHNGQLAVIAIHYNYLFDDEKDLALREWEKIHYQNSIKEYIYGIAQKLNAAVFQDDMVPFFIVTSKKMLNQFFFKQQEHVKLLKFGQQTRRFRLCLGIGLGSNMLEAKSRATMALNHAFSESGERAYIAENEQDVIVPAFTEEENQTEKLHHLAKQCGISLMTLERLKKATADSGNMTTVEDLAPRLGISIRSVNRILSKLEDSGYITIVSKKTNGKGRPARVLRIILP